MGEIHNSFPIKSQPACLIAGWMTLPYTLHEVNKTHLFSCAPRSTTSSAFFDRAEVVVTILLLLFL